MQNSKCFGGVAEQIMVVAVTPLVNSTFLLKSSQGCGQGLGLQVVHAFAFPLPPQDKWTRRIVQTFISWSTFSTVIREIWYGLSGKKILAYAMIEAEEEEKTAVKHVLRYISIRLSVW